MVNFKYNTTFKEIVKQCCAFVKKHYGVCTVVFYGYPDGPTKKDQTHSDRYRSQEGTEITISPNTHLTVKKDDFLPNKSNKTGLIKLLSDEFSSKGIKVLLATDDADSLIAQTAAQSAETTNVIVIANNTDVIVLLWHYLKNKEHRVLLQGPTKIWDIQKLTKEVGMQNLILLMHAFLGCDQTSRVFGIGKGKVWKNNTMKNAFVSAASIFYQCSSRKEDVKKAGEDLMLAVLNRTKDVTLDAARLKVFMEKIKKTRSC